MHKVDAASKRVTEASLLLSTAPAAAAGEPEAREAPRVGGDSGSSVSPAPAGSARPEVLRVGSPQETALTRMLRFYLRSQLKERIKEEEIDMPELTEEDKVSALEGACEVVEWFRQIPPDREPSAEQWARFTGLGPAAQAAALAGMAVYGQGVRADVNESIGEVRPGIGRVQAHGLQASRVRPARAPSAPRIGTVRSPGGQAAPPRQGESVVAPG